MWPSHGGSRLQVVVDAKYGGLWPSLHGRELADDSLQLGQHFVLPCLAAPATPDTVLANGLPLRNAEVERILYRAVIVQNVVATKVSWIIAVDRKGHSCFQELAYWKLVYLCHTSQEHIRHWTNAQHRSLVGNSLQQYWILGESDAVVYPFNA